MKTFDLGRPMRDGKELTDQEATDAIDEREVRKFETADERGTTQFAMLVNPANVSAQMVQDYQNNVTRLALLGAQLEKESKRLQGDILAGSDDEDETEDQDAAPEEEEVSPEDADRAADVLAKSLSLTLGLKSAQAQLLAPAVEVWNVPGLEKPTVEFLMRRTGVGPAALEELAAWFFPTTRAKAEETGTTQNPNTDSASDSSPLAPGEENTPPTS